MKLKCLSRGNGYHLPPCFVLQVNGLRILLDCPLDLSALTIFSPVPAGFCPIEFSDGSVQGTFDMEVETQNSKRIKAPVDAKALIHAEPWYKTVKNLHLWDPSSFDIVLISSTMGMLGLPFLTRSKGFSAKIYATEAAWRLGQLLMEDLVSMHMEFRQFYGYEESCTPQWMKWEELELLPSSMKEVVLGKDGSELGGWMPLYSLKDVKECMQKIQRLNYAEAACYNGTLVIKALSSGLEIGSCNWNIEGPEGNISCISRSIFLSAHAMEFDYCALQGTDLILYSDFSTQDVIEDFEHHENDSAPTSKNLSTLSAEDNWKDLNDCLLSNDESLEENEKLAFISSCIVGSVKAGGSVIVPLNRVGIVLQLLEQISVSLESSTVKVPIYFISSVAAEILAFTNTIPEWLCKSQQEKLFSGEPLFSHVELMKSKKLHVFPTVHSPNLITNWQEPCIIFAAHWSLRFGPLVPLIQRSCGDENSLLVLESGLDAELALLPFKPIAMKVLNCSFLSGIWQKVQPLLKILQPKVVMLPEHLKQQISAPSTRSHSCSVQYYTENETLDVQSLKDDFDLEIATELATQFDWRKLKQDNMDVTRLKGQVFVDGSKHWLLPGNELSNSLQSRPLLLRWGMLDMEKLLTLLSNIGITGSIARDMSDSEAETVGVIQIHDPQKALVEVGATTTTVSAPDENFAARIFEAISSLLDGI